MNKVSRSAGTLLILAGAISSVRGGSVCDLSFPACPDRFASATLAVPEGVIALYPRIPACAGWAQLPGAAAAPSVVFVIDNSTSMGGTDPAEMRFAAVANLLDDLHALSPSAEAGFVFFSRRLQFDRRDAGHFRAAFPADTSQHDAYVPLTALDADLGGRKGLDTLKALLRHDDDGNLLHATRRPGSRENRELSRHNLRDGTDLSLALGAARAALADAKAPPAARFVVLLTDGEPASVDQGREASQWDFAKGTGLPATFVVSLDTAGAGPVHDSLSALVARVRANGYSAANARSAATVLPAEAGGLQAHLRKQLTALPEVPAQPVWASLEVAGRTYASTGVNDGNLLFDAPMPLAEGSAEMRLTVGYSYSDAAPGSPVPSSFRGEKRVSYSLTVSRSPRKADLPAGLSAACREQPTLGLWSAGKEVATLGSGQSDLEARLTMPGGLPCPGCRVEASVKSARAASTDSETSPLTQAGGYLAATFLREMAGLPSRGDGRIQHYPGDSLLVTWKNPANPLDRVTRGYALPGRGPTLGVLVHNDFSRARGTDRAAASEWLLVGAPSLRIAAHAGAPSRAVAGLGDPVDSLGYVGVSVVASRSFRADIRVYDNLGQFVNKLSFAVPPAEFSKLPLGPDGQSRRLTVLWDNRSEDGRLAGTGSYVLKSVLTLDRLPGMPEEDAVKTEYRRIGVLRTN